MSLSRICQHFQGGSGKEGTSMRSFIRAYVRSMRLHYAFVTGIAG